MSGVVRDPQGLPVPNAHIELSCGRSIEYVETDEAGSFVVNARADGRCSIAASKAGFEKAAKRLAPGASSVALTLRVAIVRETVTVTADVSSSDAPVLPTGSLTTWSVSDADLLRLAHNTADLLRFAQQASGTLTTPAVVFVDGLPSSGALPPLQNIASVVVNSDPFAPDRALGDLTSIDIITKAPLRQFRWNSATDLIGFGGGDHLSPASKASSAIGSLGVSGPIPRIPVTFMAMGSLSRSSRDVPILAPIPAGSSAAVAPTVSTDTNSRWSMTDFYYSPSASLKARLSIRTSHATSTNLGAGGLALPETGLRSTVANHDVRFTVSRVSPRVLYQGGFSFSDVSAATRANSTGAGVTVAGDVTMGGAATTESATDRLRWTTKHVVRSRSGRAWMAGVELSGLTDANLRTPNAQGMFQFSSVQAYADALAGAPSATWLVTRGEGRVEYGNVAVAPFAQTELFRSNRFVLNGGMRVDYQRDWGAIVSPRLSFGASAGGFTIRGGAGLFAQSLPDSIFVHALEHDGQHLQTFIGGGVPLVGLVDDAALARQSPIVSRFSPALTRPRALLQQISVERRLGPLVPGVEYTWSSTQHLLGSTRLPDGNSWTDLVESNREAARHRVHAQVRAAGHGQQVAAHYEWIHARDNTDGPFSFIERPGHLADEWAAATGVARHNVTLAGNLRLPQSVSLTVSDTWHGSAPYTITTGLDIAGNGLMNDRGGRPRSTGEAPSYHSLSMYAARSVRLPVGRQTAGQPLRLHIGVQGDNLLDNRNTLLVGQVIGAPTFGQAIASYPGRSVRVFLNVN